MSLRETAERLVEAETVVALTGAGASVDVSQRSEGRMDSGTSTTLGNWSHPRPSHAIRRGFGSGTSGVVVRSLRPNLTLLTRS